ncbi:MAG: amidase [Geminicoccaceae bacterium]|nr:MAG: amidase [Geminicoccaceae bacterium]
MAGCNRGYAEEFRATMTNQDHAFTLDEATIASVHAAFAAGVLSAVALVEAYLARIARYDRPTGLNAITVIAPTALARAAELDAARTSGARLGPLHGVPVIVKDNYDTAGLQTAAGSKALGDHRPRHDASVVRALRRAGAIVLAKSNMAELAFDPFETHSSLAGTTRNAYALDRVPAGSSGGTASAVAANFGLVGLGTDTGNSIRGPAAHLALVGLRPTLGLVSRAGIVPLYAGRDTGGPMTRSVADAARMLDVIAGDDAADPLTRTSIGHIPQGGYVECLDAGGLRGTRLGVARQISDTPTADSEVSALFEAALRDLAAAGAVLVDPFVVPDFADLTENLWCNTLQHDLDRYLAARHPPYPTLRAIYESGLYASYVKERIEASLAQPPRPEDHEPPCTDLYTDPRRRRLRAAVDAAMDAARVDAIVYPSWSNPPRRIGDLASPHGNNSPLLAPHTGQPAITVPMGFTVAGLPGGLQLLGRLFAEPTLLRLGYAYEQATAHRRPPAGFGPP